MTGLATALAVLMTGQFVSGVSLVEVYATVTTSRGAPVVDLSVEDFVVREDGAPQEIVAFAAGEFPLSVALAIDRSWSMAGRRFAVARSAAHSFLGALRPGDQAMIVGIGSEVETLAPLSRDRQAQHRAVHDLELWGSTRLHDAILDALAAIAPAEGRRALVVLSDGDDRSSRASAADVLERVRRSDVLVYPVAVGRRLPPLFTEIAELTGARAFHVRDMNQLSSTFQEIARELRLQYLLAYMPRQAALARADDWREIAVEVTRPGLRVRARQGYHVR